MDDPSSSSEEFENMPELELIPDIPSITNVIIFKHDLLRILPHHLDKLLDACSIGRMSRNEGMPWMIQHLRTNYKLILKAPTVRDCINKMYYKIAYDKKFIKTEEKALEQAGEQDEDNWYEQKKMLDKITNLRRLMLFGIVKQNCPEYEPPSNAYDDNYNKIENYRINLIYPNRYLDKQYLDLFYALLVVNIIGNQATWRRETMHSVYDNATNPSSCFTPLM